MIKHIPFLIWALFLVFLSFILFLVAPNGRAGSSDTVISSQSFVMYPPPMRVLFEYGSAKVHPNQWYPIDFTAWAMKNIYPNGEVFVIGYASKGGDKVKNDLLSQKRAEDVARLLEKAGVPRERIVVDYRGGVQGNCASDRRVEILIQERIQ